MAHPLLPELNGLIALLRNSHSRPALEVADRQCLLAADALDTINQVLEGKPLDALVKTPPSRPDERVLRISIDLQLGTQRIESLKTYQAGDVSTLTAQVIVDDISREVQALLLRMPPSR